MHFISESTWKFGKMNFPARHTPTRTRTASIFSLAIGVALWTGSCAGFVAARNAITPATINVSGHYRSDGTWVRPHKRRPPGSRERDYPYELAAWVAAFGCGTGVLITLAQAERAAPRLDRC